jgi:hypothetical protein
MANKTIPSMKVAIQKEMNAPAGRATSPNNEEKTAVDFGGARDRLPSDFVCLAWIQQVEFFRAAWAPQKCVERPLVYRRFFRYKAVNEVRRYRHHSSTLHRAESFGGYLPLWAIGTASAEFVATSLRFATP